METTMNKKVIEANGNLLLKKAVMIADEYAENNEMTETDRKLQSLIEDGNFLNKIIAAKSIEEVHSVFVSNGIAVTMQEAEDFINDVQETSDKLMNATEELTEAELESITGGSFWSRVVNGLVSGLIMATAVAVVFACCAIPAFGLTMGALVTTGIAAGIGVAVGAASGAVADEPIWHIANPLNQ